MAKRKREDDSAAFRGRINIAEGLGKSKRVRIEKCTSIADKENIRAPEARFWPKPGPKFPVCESNVSRNAKSKKSSSFQHLPRRGVLQPKCLNVSAELKRHPISKHVLKSTLYNDEGWIGQQQALMTSILNEILSTHARKNKSWEEKELENARTTAFAYYQSDEFQIIIRRLNSVLHPNGFCELIISGIQDQKTHVDYQFPLLSRSRTKIGR